MDTNRILDYYMINSNIEQLLEFADLPKSARELYAAMMAVQGNGFEWKKDGNHLNPLEAHLLPNKPDAYGYSHKRQTYYRAKRVLLDKEFLIPVNSMLLINPLKLNSHEGYDHPTYDQDLIVFQPLLDAGIIIQEDPEYTEL